MSALALDLDGQTVTAEQAKASPRGVYLCLACGARLLPRPGKGARSPHFIHVGSPACSEEKKVLRFIHTAFEHRSQAIYSFRLSPGFLVYVDDVALSYDDALGLLLKIDKQKRLKTCDKASK